MLTILHKYLLRQNFILMSIILISGIAIYLIVDFVTRMNAVVESGIHVTTALRYFGYKIPLIVTQIMPAIFMLAVIIQLALMYRNHEMTALGTSAISFVRPAMFFIAYSFIMFFILLLFAETIGIRGYQETKIIWDSDIRQRQIEGRGIENLWFKEDETIVFIRQVWPDSNMGSEIIVHRLKGQDTIQEIIRAPGFQVEKGVWKLMQPVITDVHGYKVTFQEEFQMTLRTDLSSFSAIASRLPYESLSIFTLSTVITQLRDSGSNVERLATAWHSKIAYAFALVVMTILGLAMITLIKNVYALVTLGLVVVFLYYTVYVFGVSYAEEGLIPPFWGAWLANVLFGTLGLGQIIWSRRE
ncbi:LptF/LptG family permease [Desulfonatronovibrio magnus]|uniref:LptF/LptG family permease n=1 Tax=Desulfonatronovibrio magnus TaxID=698827 RepID=UPI0005EB804A|nr:LptF/LptG family permease [Desulfonatronovibrio magnus]